MPKQYTVIIHTISHLVKRITRLEQMLKEYLYVVAMQAYRVSLNILCSPPKGIF